MAFYQHYRSGPMPVVIREGVLVGRSIKVELDFTADVLDDQGEVVPTEAIARLDKLVRGMFVDRLLIDNNDPHADDLMKLRRIKAADPVLFDYGTSGPQLAFYMAQWAKEWLSGEHWSPRDPEDVRHTKIALSTIQIGRSRFFYDMA